MMTKEYAAVWAAIESALQQSGEADIQAGLAFLSDATKSAVVSAAISAAIESGAIKFEVKCSGGGGR